MSGRLQMSEKELKRVKLFEVVKQGHKTLKDVSGQLEISYRQTLRLNAAYREKGDIGLIHENCGKKSSNRLSGELKEKILNIYRSRYSGFGPTFVAEKLAEEYEINISVSSFRNILIESGEWKKTHNTKIYRSRRERRSRFGELIQFDGSSHKWFGEDHPSCCLMTMIDDATNARLGRFFVQETILAGMSILELWINKYGIPEALYGDKKNAFVLTHEPTDAELLLGITKPKSHFGWGLDDLGIYMITANSAQAKGRVERNHGIDQDRLIKELRLANITTIDDSNAFLDSYYYPKMNKKFVCKASKTEDAHVPLGDVDLSEILCYRYDRKVGNDYIVRFENRLFQILKSEFLPRSGDKVVVKVKLDGTLSILWKNNKLPIKEIINTKDDKSEDVA